MASNCFSTNLGRFLAACIAVTGLFAAEHHGIVKSGTQPVPGATVTATKDDKKVVTTTDDRGFYSFPDLADGVWTVSVDMFGFGPLSKEIGVAPDAPSPEWQLQYLSLAALTAKPATPAPAATTPAAGAPSTPAASAEAKPDATAKPGSSTATPPAAATTQAKNSPGGRGGQGQATNGGRPSLRAAIAQQQQQGGGGFQRLGMNQTGDTAGGDLGVNNPDMSDLNQSAADSMVVNGSMSRGLDQQQPGGDWFGGGRGGFDPTGMGGAFGAGVPGGAGGDLGATPGGPGGGGPGGRGGPGGGGPGGRGGGGGGFAGMPGAPGGRGGGRGGFGGRGGPQGPRNVNSFGNNRRDRRMQYNGNATFTLDNSVWDAKSYSLTGQETDKPSYAKARASFMLGGPLKIPHLLSGQRGQFTFNYQLARTRNGSNTSTLVPTSLERLGDFSQSTSQTGAITLYDPTTGQPFAGNIIPTSRISPIALKLLNYYPVPNFTAPGSQYNYQAGLVATSNQDNVNTRLNQTLNSKNRLSGGLGYQRSNTSTPSIFSFIDGGNMTGYNANASWQHTFTTHIINNVNYRFSRATTETLPFFATQGNVDATLGISLPFQQQPLYQGPPALQFQTGFANLTDKNTTVQRNQTSAVGDSVIWIHGLHNLTIGGDFRRQQFDPISEANPRGTLGFTGAATSLNGQGGYDFADFMLGLPDTSAVAYGNADKYFRASWWDAYVNDDWRASTKLTITGGLRWDYGAPNYELYNRLAGLDVGPGFTGIQPICAGSLSTCSAVGPLTGMHYPSSLLRPDYGGFEPRLGIAFRPSAKHSLVIRGGYGIGFNTSIYNNIAVKMSQQAPLSQSLSVASTPQNLLTLQNPFAAAQNISTSTFAIDPNYKVGYAQNWTVSVQQNLPLSMFLNATYMGTKGTHLDQQFLPNSVPNGAPLSPYPAGYTYEQSNGNSSYQAAILQLNRRFRSGFSGNLSYTFAKAIDDASTGGGLVVAQNWQDLTAERALSTFYHKNSLNMMMQYSTGVGTRGGTLVNGWKGAVLKDWTITSNLTVASGQPLTATAGGLRSLSGGTGVTGSVRAEATGLPLYPAPPGEPFNLAAFSLPVSGQWGDAGRDTIIGPETLGLNASAGRVFRIGERRSVDLRFDATNALNHPAFSSWNTTVGTKQFGALLPPGAMRAMTATLRFRF